MREERDEQQIVDAFSLQTRDSPWNGGVLIPHCQLNWHVHSLLQGSLNLPTDYDERRAFVRPDALISMCRLFWPLRQDRKMHDAKPNKPVHVENPSIHQELAEVAAHIRHRRRIRRTEVHEEDAFHGTFVVRSVERKCSIRSAALQPETIESLKDTPSR